MLTIFDSIGILCAYAMSDVRANRDIILPVLDKKNKWGLLKNYHH